MSFKYLLPGIVFLALGWFPFTVFASQAESLPLDNDSAMTLEHASNANEPDSTAIKLINLFKNKKFIVKTADGKWYEGKVSIVSDGLRVYEKKLKSLTKSEIVVVETIYWSRIEEIRLLEAKRRDFGTGALIGTIASFSFWVLMTVISFNSH